MEGKGCLGVTGTRIASIESDSDSRPGPEVTAFYASRKMESRDRCNFFGKTKTPIKKSRSGKIVTLATNVRKGQQLYCWDCGLGGL